MTSVFVEYEYQKKQLKIANRNATVQEVTTEAAKLFSVNPDHCVLKQKKTTLQSSMLFSFTQVQNLSTIQLVLTPPPVGRNVGDQPFSSSTTVASTTTTTTTTATTGNATTMARVSTTTIAFTINNNMLSSSSSTSSIIYKYSTDNLSLLDLLNGLVADGHVPSQVAASPELLSQVQIIYLRNAYTGDVLSTHTLRSLGLTGQSCRFMVKLPIMASQHTALPPGAENIPVNTSEDTTTAATTTAATTLVQNLETETVNQTISMSTETVIHDEAAAATARDVLSQLHRENFDRVTAPAVVTIAKYLANIVNNPFANKFRTINITNKVFQEKVAPAKHSLAYLAAIGFTAVASPSVSSFQLGFGDISNNNNNNNVTANATAIEYREDRKVEVLEEELRCLFDLMDTLGIPVDDRPVLKPPATADATATTTAKTNVIEFDPFKPLVVRNAQQPRDNNGNNSSNNNGESVTERKVRLLEARRRELEGSCSDVDRQTRAIFPHADGTVASLQQFEQDAGSSLMQLEDNNNDNNDNAHHHHDDKLMAQSIAAAMKKATQQEDAPLTTAAMKALQQLEKERVYRRILIRVRFPDRLCLQGYFHPRDSVASVYVWLDECLQEPFRGRRSLELFTSPPRQVLPRDSVASLYDMRYAPAAILNVNWLKEDDSFKSSDSGAAVTGYYLTDALLSRADDRHADAAVDFPKSEELVAKRKIENDAKSGTSSNLLRDQNNNKLSNSKADASADGKTSTNKLPKWFRK